MNNSKKKLAYIIDYTTLLLGLSVLSILFYNSILRNLVFSFILGFVTSIASFLFIITIIKKLNAKSNKIKKENTSAKQIMDRLSNMNLTDVKNLLASMLKTNFKVTKDNTNGLQLINSTQKSKMLFYLYKDIIKIDDIAFQIEKNNKYDYIYIWANEFDLKVYDFYKKNNKIILINYKSAYNIIKSYNVEDKFNLITKKKMRDKLKCNFIFALSHNTKYYIKYGIIIILLGFIFPHSIIYFIVGSFLIVFSLICLIWNRKNKQISTISIKIPLLQ